MSAMEGERIAKVMARAGLCSRREAERWIAEGRVAIDGRVLDSPAVAVEAGAIVTVDGKVVGEPERARIFRLNKPRGVLTTAHDERGRKALDAVVPPGLPRLMPIGRLDMDSEGLLLLTNDGGLKRRLELPATGWIRRYRVRVFGAVDPAALEGLKKGIRVEGVNYGPISASLDRAPKGRNAWLTVALQEGKNREIRRVMAALGLSVNRLIRTAYGPFQLGALPEGAIDEIPAKVLREQLGAAPAAA